LTILAFAFVLGILIFVHELGHFMMARRIGVRVLTFSLGFGPKILNIHRGGTDYCVSIIPLGGYVKMAGENPDDQRTGASDEFLSKSKWQRFQVLVMGPVMNVVLALVVMTVVLYQGAQVPLFDEQPVVIGTFSETSPAKAAGLQPGDHVVTIDGKPIDNWDQFSMAIVPKAKREVAIGFIRNGKAGSVTVVPAAHGKFDMGDIGIMPTVHPQIGDLTPGMPAAQAGLKTGDVILAAGDQKDVTYEHLLAAIKAHDGQPLTLTVRRNDQAQQITVTPRPIENKAICSGACIGAQISAFETRMVEPGPIEAAKLSAQKNWEWTRLIVQTLVGLFTRETSVKQLMGPVAIADLSGSAAEAGWIPLFSLMAMISLNLGLLNLMPIPVLDGGHIFILFLESLARRDFSMRVKEKMLLAGFVLLLMLMVTVIYNDLMRIEWIQRLVPWH
jgi:regulator of sigma E protease